jgi:glycosyltransferase involved in cell wall biosynthesis
VSQRSGADVIVTADRDPTMIEPRLQNILAHGGSHLRRLIVVDDDDSADSEMPEMLERLSRDDSRVRVVRNSPRLARVGAYNRGLEERQGDAVLVSSDCIVGADWLGELFAVAHSTERTACAAPLTNGHGACSVPVMGSDAFSSEIAEAIVREACVGLPGSTTLPNVNGACVYLRGEIIDAVGLLDAKLTSLEEAIKDWVGRASMLGFTASRANHVYVHRSRLRGDGGFSRGERGENLTAVGIGHRDLEHQLKRFQKSLDGRLAAHAVRVQSSGRLRVAYDIRHLPREQVGTRTYAVCLGQYLSKIPEIELTLLVREPAQADGLEGRVVTPDQWQDDVDVIHKPAQVIAPAELKLLFDSSAHVVMTYQDLIGYQIPSAFSTDLQHDHYRATSSLSIQAVQRIIAYSRNAGREITAEFGIPADEVCVVPLGVDATWFECRKENDAAIARKLGLAGPFFFSIATDFPHKNLPNLLDAYALLRSRWRAGTPPHLVLAGHTSGARTNFYTQFEARTPPEGVTFLGTVTRDELRVLYQRAVALVFPSLYEGFGLPPLEAMAAGTPVIAMRVSAVPEVGGDAVLYADDMSPTALASAMESVATSPSLHDELRDRGRKRIEDFRWEKTARATVDVYHAAVSRPAQRSLHARRMLRDAIVRWSEPRGAGEWSDSHDELELFLTNRPIGIKNAFRVLNVSLHSRLLRELRRIRSASGRRSA